MPRIKAFQALRPVPDLAAQSRFGSLRCCQPRRSGGDGGGQSAEFSARGSAGHRFPPSKNPYDSDIYVRASDNFQKLISDGVLQRDPADCVYAYRQIMGSHSQVGIVCCCHIDDYENNLILKHEKTRKTKEDDRTHHVLALNANAGPVFLTYRGVEHINFMVAAATQAEPLYDFVAVDGVQHTVWRIEDAQPFVEALSAVPRFYIADGHHRAASAWRAGTGAPTQTPGGGTGNEECNWFLSVLFPSSQLRILAYNRVLKEMNGHTVSDLLEKLGELGELSPADSPVPDAPGSFCFSD